MSICFILAIIFNEIMVQFYLKMTFAFLLISGHLYLCKFQFLCFIEYLKAPLPISLALLNALEDCFNDNKCGKLQVNGPYNCANNKPKHFTITNRDWGVLMNMLLNTCTPVPQLEPFKNRRCSFLARIDVCRETESVCFYN